MNYKASTQNLIRISKQAKARFDESQKPKMPVFPQSDLLPSVEDLKRFNADLDTFNNSYTDFVRRHHDWQQNRETGTGLGMVSGAVVGSGASGALAAYLTRNKSLGARILAIALSSIGGGIIGGIGGRVLGDYIGGRIPV